MADALHTLTASCWCQPATPLDGHINEDGTAPEFAATDLDPVDADGFLVEERGDEPMTDAELDAWLKKANDDLIAVLDKHIDKEAGLREVFRRARRAEGLT